MYPILFTIGPFALHTYGVVHALAYLTGGWWIYRQAKTAGLDADKVLDLSLVVFVASLVGARVFSILFDGNLWWYLDHPLEILAVWKGGLTFYGGFLFGFGAGIWYARKKHLDGWIISDVFAPGIAIGAAIARIGCFASGDSFGKPTDLPWAVTFTDPHALAPLGITLHPTQLYSVVANLGIFAVLLWWRKRRRFDGELFLAYLVLYAVTRSLIEIFRNDPRGVYFGGFLSTSQIVGIIGVVGAVLVWWARWRESAALRSIQRARQVRHGQH